MSTYGAESRILKEMYETAKGQYFAGTMSYKKFLEFEKICKPEKTGNKVSKKVK